MYSQRCKLPPLHNGTGWAAGPQMTIGDSSPVNGPGATVATVGVATVGGKVGVATTAGTDIGLATTAGTKAGARVEVGALEMACRTTHPPVFGNNEQVRRELGNYIVTCVFVQRGMPGNSR